MCHLVVTGERRPGGGRCLYVADIGDNQAERARITIFRVPEPAAADAQNAWANRDIGEVAVGALGRCLVASVGGRHRCGAYPRGATLSTAARSSRTDTAPSKRSTMRPFAPITNVHGSVGSRQLPTCGRKPLLMSLST